MSGSNLTVLIGAVSERWNWCHTAAAAAAGCAVVICAATEKVQLPVQTGIAGQQTAIFQGLIIVIKL